MEDVPAECVELERAFMGKKDQFDVVELRKSGRRRTDAKPRTAPPRNVRFPFGRMTQAAFRTTKWAKGKC